MDIIILCHTEFGFVHDRKVIYDKNATDGVKKGVTNLIKVAEKYGAKITFAVMPETVTYFPTNVEHEFGLHIHPGWVKTNVIQGFSWFVGDSYLKEHCKTSVNSTILPDYSYNYRPYAYKARSSMRSQIGLLALHQPFFCEKNV